MIRKKRKDFEALDGILLLDKSVGNSSNRALQQARHLFNARKAGHTGSLDPLASGLLPICFGEATKLSQYLIDADKRYFTNFFLGVETTTGDAEGEVLETRPVNITRKQLEDTLADFSGKFDQIPPMYSALKQDGQPLYRLARKGIEVERKARAVEVFDISLVEFKPPHIALDVHCSKGFYIRSLAFDLGRVLGCGARVDTLRRVTVGQLRVENAYSMDMLSRMDANQRSQVLLPLEQGLYNLPSVSISPQSAVHFRQGQAVAIDGPGCTGTASVFINHKEFIGLGEIKANGMLQPKRLLAQLKG